jgi:putative ABC transport system permease protein
LIAATLNLSGPLYRDKTRRSAFLQELLERTHGIPGVELATLTTGSDIPPGDYHATNSFAIEGRDQPLGGPRPIGLYPMVSPDYFAIMGIPLREGRLIVDSDGASAPPVSVVNQALVRRYFDRQNPVGHRLRTGGADQPWTTIVGVVGDVKTSGLASAAEPTIYLPYRQADLSPDVGLMIRSPLDAGTIATELRKTVASLDPNQPVATVQTMDDRLTASVSGPRFTTVLLFVFAGLAVLLGLIGVYSVMSCRVRWQLRELAVRQALGAQRKDVISHVLRQGFAIILPGVIAGFLAAIWLSRLLSSILYEVSAHDPLTFAAVSAALVAVALLACWIPAMRAARVDPLESGSANALKTHPITG